MKVLNNSPSPKFQKAWLWHVEVHTRGQKGLAKQISPAIKAYSTWSEKSWMPKVCKFTKAMQDTGMVPGQALAGENIVLDPPTKHS